MRNEKGQFKKGYKKETPAPFLGKKLSKKHKNKIAKAMKGGNSTSFKKGNVPHNTGKHHLAKEKHFNWKGGITPINQQIRGSLEYKLWSDSVWNRDKNCCQKCGENRVRYLVAHHILNFSSHIELRFAIDNGITFCRLCHKEFHHIYTKRNNTREQVVEFIRNESIQGLR